MRDRTVIYDEYIAAGASGTQALEMEMWLDMRDLLNTIRMTSNWELNVDDEEEQSGE